LDARYTESFRLTLRHYQATTHDTKKSPFFEIALVFVRLDDVASFIVNASHGIM
jgi:hypothetical protein